MVRNYKRILGVTPYKYYNTEKIDFAVKHVKRRKYTGGGWKICFAKIGNRHTSAPGRPKAITNEWFLIDGIKTAEWGFPLRMRDIRGLIYIYLQNKGISDKRFKNGNNPRKEWKKNCNSWYKEDISVKYLKSLPRKSKCRN